MHKNYIGNKAKYLARHSYVKRRIGPPKKCEICGIKPYKTNGKMQIDLSNKSGKYKRSVKDWWYLCKKCHSRYDNRAEKISKSRKGYVMLKSQKIDISNTIKKIWKTNPQVFLKNWKPPMQGKSHKKSTINKMSIARKLYWKNRKR